MPKALRNTCQALLCLLFSLVPATSFSADRLVLGIHPYKAPSKLLQAYRPLADHLSRKLGIPVDIKISSDYQEHIDAIGRDELDIAYLGPASYVKLVAKYGHKPLLARQALRGNPTFHGKIIVREDSPIQTLSQVKGQRMAFGDPASTMSHLVPRYMLWRAGVGIEQMAKHEFLGSHDNVALAVLSGDYDVGAVKEAIFHKYRSRGLRAIATTPALSDHLFVASNKLSEERIEQIRNVFFDLGHSADGIKVMYRIKRGITAMLPVSDSDYANLREILQTLDDMGVNE